MANYTPDPFVLASDGVDPASIPQHVLNSGYTMPGIAFGTFGLDVYTPDQIADAVKNAVAAGFRLFDCATVYGNQKQIGQALAEVFASGVVKREEVFVVSKMWNDMHGKGDVLVACAEALRDLQLDYIDLYLMHYPVPNYTENFSQEISPRSRPFFIEEFMETWRQMEKLVDMGLVRSIGVSNVTVAKMKEIWPEARIKPAANEVELHPHLQQPELVRCMDELGVKILAYSPLGSPNRPERDRTPEDTVDMEDPLILELAAKYQVHPAIICLKWSAQNGCIPIPFSIHRDKYLSNLNAMRTFKLTPEEMARLSEIDKNSRTMKGVPYLWPGAESWENFWDIHGVVDRTGWKG